MIRICVVRVGGVTGVCGWYVVVHRISGVSDPVFWDLLVSKLLVSSIGSGFGGSSESS